MLRRDPLEDKSSDALRARIAGEIRNVVEVAVVEYGKHLAQRGLQKTEIQEHSALAELVAGGPDMDLVVVAMQALALAVIMEKPMGRREGGLDPHFVHRRTIARGCRP